MADTDAASISFKKRTNKSTNIRKRPATPPPEEEDNSTSDYTSSDNENESGVRIKRRKKEGLNTTTASSLTRPADLSKSTQYTASRSTTLSANDDATKTAHWSVSDAAAAAARTDPGPPNDTPTSEGTYKGSSTYSTFISKNPNAPTRAVGPVKAAPGNVRTITVTDFAPDVCKDYKQTGFCGFGDNCKFLHAREDYKQGWQLDKEWESVGKKKDGKDGKDQKGKEMTEEEKLLEGIPFVCIICKEDYKKPVVTKCGHYFCEACAMGRYVKGKKRGCANCGADTGGSFGMARKLEGLLVRKKRRMEVIDMAEKEAGEGEE